MNVLGIAGKAFINKDKQSQTQFRLCRSLGISIGSCILNPLARETARTPTMKLTGLWPNLSPPISLPCYIVYSTRSFSSVIHYPMTTITVTLILLWKLPRAFLYYSLGDILRPRL